MLLVVRKARHGEGSGEELHPLAELCDAGHRLCVLQQKGLEAGQVPFERREGTRQQVQSEYNSMDHDHGCGFSKRYSKRKGKQTHFGLKLITDQSDERSPYRKQL